MLKLPLLLLFIRWAVSNTDHLIILLKLPLLLLFIRWAVSNTDHLIILLKLPLLLFIYLFIYFSYFDPLFCVQDNLKMAQSNILKFNTHMYRHIHKTQQIFRP